MDRFTFLEAQTWLTPRAEVPTNSPLFSGLASFSFSVRENAVPSNAAQQQESPLGACAPDAKHLFFLTSEATPDATCLRCSLHERDADGLSLVLDGRAYDVRAQAVQHVVARTPAPSSMTPPFVSVLVGRVTLNLVPLPDRAWAVEAPTLLAAANAFERCRGAPERSSGAATADTGTEQVLAQWRGAVDALCEAVSCGATDARLASAVARLAAGTAAVRLLGNALPEAHDALAAVLAAPRAGEEGAAALSEALQAADAATGTALDAALAQDVTRVRAL